MDKLLNEINELIATKFVEVDGVKCLINIFLGGEYKILLITMGLNGATSTYAYLWCKVHKSKRFDMSKPKDYYNSAPDSRTLEELHELYSLSKSHEKYSCIGKPLINIPLHHVILDELHLMLRVTDRLMENLILEIMEREIAKKT